MYKKSSKEVKSKIEEEKIISSSNIQGIQSNIACLNISSPSLEKNLLNQNRLLKLKKAYSITENFIKNNITAIFKTKDIKALKLLGATHNLNKYITPEEFVGKLKDLVKDDNNLNFIKASIGLLDTTIKKKIKESNDILWISAVYNAKKVLEYLLQEGFDVNQSNKGYTPLHFAGMHKNINIIQVLLQYGAKDIPDPSGITYKQYLANYNPNYKPPSKSLVDNYHTYHSGLILFYKAIFSDNININYLVQAIQDFQSFINKFISFTNDYVPLRIYDSLLNLIDILSIYNHSDRNSLENYIIQNALFLKEKYSEEKWGNVLLENIYTLKYKEARKASDNKAALLNINQVYKLYGLDKLSEHKKYKLSQKYYKLGYSFSGIDIALSSECFDKAHVFTPQAEDVILAKFNILYNAKSVSKCLEYISTIQDEDLKDLLAILIHIDFKLASIFQVLNKFNFTRFKTEELKSLKSKNKYLLYIDIRAGINMAQGNSEEALKQHKLVLENVIDKNNIAGITDSLVKILHIYYLTHEWKEGLKFLQEFYQKKEYDNIKRDFPLQYMEYLIYENNNLYNDATIILENLIGNSKLGNFIAYLATEACLIRVFNEANKDNFTEAKKYLSRAPQLNNLFKEKLGLLVDTLEKINKHILQPLTSKTENVKAGLLSPSLSELKDTKVDSAIIDLIGIEDFKDEYINLDPKVIHSYFQQKKQEILKKKVQDLENNYKSMPAWLINGKVYNTSEKNIYELPARENSYITIDRKSFDKLDNNQQDKIINALKNGNIKFLGRKLIELWINDDLRFYTNTIYSNEQNKHLIIFDYYGNHNDVKRAAETSKLEVQNVPDTLYTGEGISTHYDSSFWNVYSSEAMYNILKLRIDSCKIDQEVPILITNYTGYNSKLLSEELLHAITKIDSSILLVPLNLFNMHWVGLVITQEEGKINIKYIDPEQKPLPFALKELLEHNLNSTSKYINIIEKHCEHQNYNNCGPEVIENFIEDLTGYRIDQESVPYIHSSLYEETLLGDCSKTF